jgi:5-amino-6-(5-phospho-D-ribitylamino)uracil phosphatase
MTPKYRLLAVDVDGTLMNSRNQLPDANREALHRAHAAGITLCLCTGRSWSEARGVIEQLNLDLDLGIFVFGAAISELPSGRTVKRTPIPDPLATRLVEHFQSDGHPVLVLYDVTEAGLDYRLVRGSRNQAAYEQWLRVSPANCQVVDGWEAGGPEPLRIGIIEQPADIRATMERLAAEFPPVELKYNPIYAPNYGMHVVECFSPQVNKWYGITQVAHRLGIEASQIATIGDDVNDVEMIAQAGLGIAMGNAIERVKAVAKWHAPTNDQAGLAAAVDALMGRRGPLVAVRE